MNVATSELVERLAQVLATGPELRLAVLLGSRTGTKARIDSDVDIAVSFAHDDVSLSEELELQVRLERATGHTVDIVRLDEASTVLRWEVAARGIPIVAREHEWPRFRARAASEYADFRPALEAAAERFRARLAQGPR